MYICICIYMYKYIYLSIYIYMYIYVPVLNVYIPGATSEKSRASPSPPSWYP